MAALSPASRRTVIGVRVPDDGAQGGDRGLETRTKRGFDRLATTSSTSPTTSTISGRRWAIRRSSCAAEASARDGVSHSSSDIHNSSIARSCTGSSRWITDPTARHGCGPRSSVCRISRRRHANLRPHLPAGGVSSALKTLLDRLGAAPQRVAITDPRTARKSTLRSAGLDLIQNLLYPFETAPFTENLVKRPRFGGSAPALPRCAR